LTEDLSSAGTLEWLVGDLADPGRSLPNLEVPRVRTAVDQAPELDTTLKPVIGGGSVAMARVWIPAGPGLDERYQPLAALHGHTHESQRWPRKGRTVCINHSSKYAQGCSTGGW